MQSVWEEAHSVALRAHLNRGLSFSEVARALNRQFGTAYTRNATIGRARRMGLSVPLRPDSDSVMSAPRRPDARRIVESRARKHAAGSPKPSSAKPSSAKPSSAKPSSVRRSTFERAEALQLRCVAITPRHLSLVDLEADDCRYPYGGDADGEPITFCGHPRHEGSSYCLSHFHLTSLPEAVTEATARPRAPLRLVEAA
jgi:GcrA cell cycle regulator